MILNWKTQIRKGYLDLCILTLIEAKGRVYGFEVLEDLKSLEFPVKEGTVYPLLSRMTNDGLLEPLWETQGKGHPRKFYSLTPKGSEHLKNMESEFIKMIEIYRKIKNGGISDNKSSS